MEQLVNTYLLFHRQVMFSSVSTNGPPELLRQLVPSPIKTINPAHKDTNTHAHTHTHTHTHKTKHKTKID